MVFISLMARLGSAWEKRFFLAWSILIYIVL